MKNKSIFRERKELNYSKTVKKSWPKKGVCIELEEHYWSRGCPRRSWTVYVKFTGSRGLTTSGILTTKEEAESFYWRVWEVMT